MNRFKVLAGNALSDFPILKSFLRIFLDKRYLYHNFQGFFTSYSSRKILKTIELFFYKERVDTYNQIKTQVYEGSIELINDGIIENPISINEMQVQEISNYLSDKLCHDPEVRNSPYFKIADASSEVKKAYYMCEDLVNAPHVLAIANNDLLVSCVSDYFGAVPSIDYIGAWWSLPSITPSLTQSFHRDIDTLHSLKFFIYLTDVDVKAGPHVYIKGSSNSNFDSTKDKMHSDDEIINFFDKTKITELTGPSGFCFLADTFGLHKGMIPTESPRLLLQIIYSLKQTPFGPKNPLIYYNAYSLKKVNLYKSDLVNNNIIRKTK
jgi:hypothetical protein